MMSSHTVPPLPIYEAGSKNKGPPSSVPQLSPQDSVVRSSPFPISYGIGCLTASRGRPRPLANELGFSAECFTNREARLLAGLKNEHEMQRLIGAAQELTLLQERQASLGRTNEIDPPSHPC